MFLCLPGLFGLGISLFAGPSLSLTRADAWAALYVSGVANLNHRLLFLEDYEGGGWEERTGDPELEWRRI